MPRSSELLSGLGKQKSFATYQKTFKLPHTYRSVSHLPSEPMFLHSALFLLRTPCARCFAAAGEAEVSCAGLGACVGLQRDVQPVQRSPFQPRVPPLLLRAPQGGCVYMEYKYLCREPGLDQVHLRSGAATCSVDFLARGEHSALVGPRGDVVTTLL